MDSLSEQCSQQQQLEKLIERLPAGQINNICDALIKFSGNLLTVVSNDNRYKHVAGLIGIQDRLKETRDIEKAEPVNLILLFDKQYNRKSRKSSLLKYHEETIEEAAVDCDITIEFIDQLNRIGVSCAALVLASCREKYAHTQYKNLLKRYDIRN